MAEKKTCPKCGAALDSEASGELCPACVFEQMAEDPFANDYAIPADHDFPGYTDVEKIGEGGMSHVFKARHEVLDRWVAIKTPGGKIANNPEFIERFLREARAMAKLKHPHIVPIYEFGETADGHPFFTMELVDGVTLRELIREGMSPDQILEIASQICDALHHAHQHGFIHRDIKPGNILISTDGEVKVADFGLTKTGCSEDTDLSLTMTEVSMGTPAYMAPEQADSTRDVDQRADIYALGVMLYEMFTGELPQGAYKAPSQIRNSVGDRVDDLVEKAMQRDPAERYGNATEVKSEIQEASKEWKKTTTKRKRSSGAKLSPVLITAALVIFLAGMFSLWPRHSTPEELKDLPVGRAEVIPLPMEQSWSPADFENRPIAERFVRIDSAGNRHAHSRWFAGLTRKGTVYNWGPGAIERNRQSDPNKFKDCILIHPEYKRLFALTSVGKILRSDQETSGLPTETKTAKLHIGGNCFYAIDENGKLSTAPFGYYHPKNRYTLTGDMADMRFVTMGATHSAAFIVREDGAVYFSSSTKPFAEVGIINPIPVDIVGDNRSFFLTMPNGTLRYFVDGEFVPLPDPILEDIDDAMLCKFQPGMKNNVFLIRRKAGGWHVFQGEKGNGEGKYTRLTGVEKRLANAIDVAPSDRYVVALIPEAE